MKYKLLSLIIVSLFVFSSCSLFGSKGRTDTNTTPNTNTITDTGSDNNSNSDAVNTDTNADDNENSGDNNSSVNPSGLSSDEKSWYYVPKTNGVPSGEPKAVLSLINSYDAYYLGDTSRKIIYLTFDEGYENGYTSKILDTLAANNVQAAFFVTRPYITGNSELVARMVKDGHLVCNHSNTHVSMASLALKSQDTFNKEFYDTEQAFTDLTGRSMDKFFRPPMGNYSELSLFYTKSLGYKTIFWSFAYRDWETDNQPAEADAINLIREHTHNGGIFLLHAVSKTNADILDSLIKEWKGEGFEFASLYELPSK
ncbi:MAG: delta-lactam-biosynthetic de-N-acetylase [Clostridiaceae bacterium]